MGAVCRITVDARELVDGVPRALAERGVEVTTERLATGDYRLPNGLLVEGKTTRGLDLAIVDGRLWRQIGDLRHACAAPYLLLEGNDLQNGPLTPASVRGVCLKILGHSVPIIWSLNELESADWLHQLAKHAIVRHPARDRPV